MLNKNSSIQSQQSVYMQPVTIEQTSGSERRIQMISNLLLVHDALHLYVPNPCAMVYGALKI
ncbi:hypothetical protein A2U01_0052190, partial [Trifolium medium]|nr:hypothetical protein [Trifolium medium]